MNYSRDGVVIRESTEQDIQQLKNKLREADVKEIVAAGNTDGEDALRQSYSRSEVRFTVELHGNPVAMFGVLPDGNVWFLGADEMSHIKKTFVKLSRHVIDTFLLSYPVLWNVVDCRYVSSIAWLKSCGAIFHHAPIMIDNVEFSGFTIRRA